MKIRFRNLLYLLTGALLLMADAFYNGFPIVYSDTSTYLVSGFELGMPFDRPVTYGIFLRLVSLNGLSLWLVIFTQAIIVSRLIFMITKLIAGNSYQISGLIIILFLSLFSGLSWTVSQLMPDIFTPVALMCMLLLLSGKYDKSWSLYILFFLSVAMHMSHIVLFSLLFFLVFLFRKIVLPNPQKKKQLAVMIILTMLSIVTMSSAMAKSKHVFFMGAMAEHGILKEYLYEYGDEYGFKLNAYRDSLPDKAYKFVWDSDSPFYKTGGWKNSKTEYNRIIYGSFTKPKFILIHIRESLKATADQLSLFKIGDGNGSFNEGSKLNERISKYFPHEVQAFNNSKQNHSELKLLNFFNVIFRSAIVISLILLIIGGIMFRKQISSELKMVIIIFSAGILLNAWDCGTFANAIDRLGCKMIWLLPFMTILFLFQRKNFLKAIK